MIDLDAFSGKLSMSRLLSLEPVGIRRLLKSGLRRGATNDEVAVILKNDCQLDPESLPAQQLLEHFKAIGWFVHHGDRWKTHF